MSTGNYQIYGINIGRTHFDNRVDNKFKPIGSRVSYNDYTNYKTYFWNNKPQQLMGRIKLDNYEGGTILLQKQLAMDVDTIVLVDGNYVNNIDKERIPMFFYFFTSTGRVFNNFYEYQIKLDYYSTFGELFMFGNIEGNGDTNPWALSNNMVVEKSNLIPIMFHQYDGVNFNDNQLGNVNTKASWLEESVSNLPENLKISNNNNNIVKINNNIFDASYATEYGDKFLNSTVTFTRIDPYTGTLESLEGNGRPWFSSIQVRSNYSNKVIDFEVIYEKELTTPIGNPIAQWNYTANGNIPTMMKNISTIIRTFDTDEWVILSVPVAKPAIANKDIGNAAFDKKETGYNFLVAVPYSTTLANLTNINIPNDVLACDSRWFGKYGAVTAITRVKSQNFFKVQPPSALMILSGNSMGVNIQGQNPSNENGTDGDMIVGFVLNQMYAWRLFAQASPLNNNPEKYRDLPPISRVDININPSVQGKYVVNRPKTFEDVKYVFEQVSGYRRHIISCFGDYMIYDWTKFRRNPTSFTVNYFNLGYEMCWITNGEDKFFWRMTRKPWEDSWMTLGLCKLQENNIYRYDSTYMSEARANSRQWQVGQNQAQFNGIMSLVTTGLGVAGAGLTGGGSLLAAGGILKGLSGAFKGLSTTQKVGVGLTGTGAGLGTLAGLGGQVTGVGNAMFDSMKLPAMKQDLMSSSVGTYPAGDMNVLNRETIGYYEVLWNDRFLISVHNYLAENGWVHRLPSNNRWWGEVNASALFTYDNNYTTRTGYVRMQKFERNTNLVNQKISYIASYYNMPIWQSVRDWFCEWMFDGVRIWYPELTPTYKRRITDEVNTISKISFPDEAKSVSTENKEASVRKENTENSNDNSRRRPRAKKQANSQD